MATTEAPPAGTVAVPVTPAPAAPAAPPRPVEQRVVSTEVRTRNLDEPPPEGSEQRFLEVLPRELLEGASLPLSYRLASPTGYTGVTVRIAESDPARARGYPCLTFYKPISRCVGGKG
ncbi:MAG TPA: hypothetical protein VFX98_13215 [Longimicrobiaceae bacterium]|nr:hypothetical protein [Longimicrobiaceae bacterium]